MNRATLARLEKMLAPAADGIVRELVGLHEVEGGFRCDVCDTIHADMGAAQQAHPGPAVAFLNIRVVGADRQPISGASPG